MKRLFLVTSQMLLSIFLVNAQQPDNHVPTVFLGQTTTPIALSGYTDRTMSLFPFTGNKVYQKKSRRQKTAAFVLLTGGMVTTVAGLIIITTNTLADATIVPIFDILSGNSTSTNTSNTQGNITCISGLAMMAGSIPFFIAASRNKHKSKMMIKYQPSPQGLPIAISKNITGLSISLPIGK